MNISEKNRAENWKERLTNMIGLIILFTFGLILLYGFYRLENSETIAHYFNVAAGDPSGFRFIAFLGLLKYGILLLGAVLTIMTVIMLIKKIKTPHNNIYKQ